jgi:DNA topoisomerase VI subunit B
MENKELDESSKVPESNGQAKRGRDNRRALHRETFETYRDSEYFSVAELQTKTGQPKERFAAVAVKELFDNGADAAEKTRVAPELCIGVMRGGGLLRIHVRDNGDGIPPETVDKILNFRTKTSDKAAYATPTRGQQGNAWKTHLGMPYALGAKQPVIIEAKGIRHDITASLDPAGEALIERVKNPSDRPGTRVTLTLPAAGLEFSPVHWARSFARFNPHALVKILVFDRDRKQANGEAKKWTRVAKIYRPTQAFPGSWRKFLPDDLPSPWWFDNSAMNKLVFSHIGAARRGGRDLPLRDFVRQFRGLSGTKKAKLVGEQFPSIHHLSDFAEDKDLVAKLLAAMRNEVEPPSPSVLGFIGESHFRTRFEAWFGIKRFWYRKVELVVKGVPYVFEAAVAQTKRPGRFFHGANFSPTFDDPLAATPLQGPEFFAPGTVGFLERAHAHPADSERPRVHTAVAVHLTSPALRFLDQGKTRLSLPLEVAKQISRALWLVTKELYREEERRRRDAARQARADRELDRQQRPKKGELRRAVFQVLPEALKIGTGDGAFPISAHTLFYKVRPLIQPITSIELTSDYFEQKLWPLYQKEFGSKYTVYYEPRGTLHEPHTGKQVPLGTLEVEAYHFPEFLCDKIFFIEKKGLWQVLEAAKLGERYDMAIVAGEGYATEACRVLFKNAQQGVNYQLFVGHDADPHGYNIGRIMREATWRMPGYSVDVIDVGLKLEEGLALGLPTEEFTRKRALPQGLELTPLEREYFEGQRVSPKSWLCRRIELNAFGSPDLIAYFERKLQANGVRGKVIPPAGQLKTLAKGIFRRLVDEQVAEELVRLLRVEEIKDLIANQLQGRVGLGDARQWIEQAFAEDISLSWREALTRKISSNLAECTTNMQSMLLQEIDNRSRGR